MNGIEEIKEYKPIDEQEKKDKELMLEYVRLCDNILTRECELAHFTSSGFVVNKQRDKVLMVFHNIYQSWAWTGGHVDGENDFLSVAIRETKEETGVKQVTPIVNTIFSLEILPVWGHIKRGNYVGTHQHLNVSYLLEVDEQEVLQKKEDENSGVKWIPIDQIKEYSNEKDMYFVYDKIVKKMRDNGLDKG